jgi:hypothetical protein
MQKRGFKWKALIN